MQAHLHHPRLWRDFDYCYPVISRRSKGVSLGVNLSPSGVCNFDCVYCEVDRCSPPRRKNVDLDQLEQEMAYLLDLSTSGEIFSISPFDAARPEQRRLNDIAFSGDGEPTAAAEFPGAVSRLARMRKERGLNDLKLVLITNSTRLQSETTRQGLETLMDNGGEIWAKLDAGTEVYYREVNRSLVPYSHILENLVATSKRWAITLQTLFMEWKGQRISEGDLEGYIECVRYLLESGGQLQGIQAYTIARPTPEAEARPLRADILDAIATRLRTALPTLPVDVYYGPDAPLHV